MKHLFKILFGAVHGFEVDPVEQYHFHLAMTWLWLVVMIFVPNLSVFKNDGAALLIMEVSLWANFVSHFTAVGASLAGIIASGRQEELKKRSRISRFVFRAHKPKPFTNPNYRPPSMESKGLGWDESESDGYLDMLAKDAGEADF